MVTAMQFILHLAYHNHRFSVTEVAGLDVCTKQLVKVQFRNNLKKRSKPDREQAQLQHIWFACCVAEFCANRQSVYLLTTDPLQLNRLSLHEIANALAVQTGASVSTLSRWLKEYKVSVLFQNKLIPCSQLIVRSGQVERIRACYAAINALQNQGLSLSQITNDMVYHWLRLHHNYTYSRRATNEEFQYIKFQLMLNNFK